MTSADRQDMQAALEEHASLVRAGSFRTADGIGFGVVDMTQTPPRGLFLAVNQSGKPAAVESVYHEGVSGDASLSMLAATAFDAPMRQLPLSHASRSFGMLKGGESLAGRSAAVFVERFGMTTVEEVAAFEQERFEKSGLAELRPLLDTEALAALRATDSFSTAEYAFYAAGGDRGVRRRQAADVYPLLAGVMARKPIIKLAIDAQRPLNAALTAAFGNDQSGRPHLGKGMLRRLQGVDWPTMGVAPERVAAALGEIPPDWFPKSREDWEAFCTVAGTVGGILKDVTGSDLDVLCAGCSGKWASYARTIAKAYTDTRPPEDLNAEERDAWEQREIVPDAGPEAMRNACLDAEDMVESFARMIVLPAAAHAAGDPEPFLSEVHRSQARMAAAAILFGGKAAPAIFELTRHWHSQQEAIMEAALGEDEANEVRLREARKDVAPDGWPPLCNSVQAPNDVWIVPLTDPRELKDEGRHGKNDDGSMGLFHCVGGYSAGCKKGEKHIVSLRRIDRDTGLPRRLSTLEVGAVAEGERMLSERQHRGNNNTTPPAAAMQARDWFFESVRDGNIGLNYEGIRSYVVAKHEMRDDVRIGCGYDWKGEGAISKAMRLWAPYVGKRYRKMGLEDFSREAEIADVADLIAPPQTGFSP